MRCIYLIPASAVPLSSFYPYGPDHGDLEIGPSDDGSKLLILSQDFVFFGTKYSQIHVRTTSSYIYTLVRTFY